MSISESTGPKNPFFLNYNPSGTPSAFFAQGELSQQALRVAPFYFAITGNGISESHPSYLLGIKHELKSKDLPPTVLKTIEKCDVLACQFYLKPNNLKYEPDSTLEFVGKFLKEMEYNFHKKNYRWFRKYFKHSNYNKRTQNEKFSQLNVSIREFAPRKYNWVEKAFSMDEMIKLAEILREFRMHLTFDSHPAFIAKALFMKIVTRKQDEFCIESETFHYFKKENKSIVELDDPDMRLASLVDNFFIELAERSIDEYIEDIKKNFNIIMRHMEKLQSGIYEDDTGIDYYDSLATGKVPLDVEGLKTSSSDENNLGLQVSNVKWQSKYLKVLQEGKSALILTGYEHLQGKTGIIQTLENNGYKVSLIR